ncbi:hypothetical protein Bca4012_066554 [Brassica carinata]
MTQRNMMTGFDMEQHSLPDIPPMNPVPTFEPYDNNSMFNGHPHYHHPHPHHHHPQQQGASNLGPVMSTPPNLYLPYEPFHTPPNHPSAPGSTPHFMGHGYKRKSAEAVPGNYQYLTEAAPPCSFPYYSTTTYPQPIDQRSVRSRVGADPPPYYPHGHDSFFQGSYAAHPVPPPGPIWYDQHCNGNTSDGPPSLWLQPPSVPFMHGNFVTGSVDSGNVCLPRFHEASSGRNDMPFAYPSPHYFSHHLAPPPPPTVYPRMASASYTVPMNIHDASYRIARPVQSTGLRINQQHPRDGFSPAATLRHHGLPHLRAFPAYELLDLSDHIGTVKTGLPEETVKELVKRRTSISTRINLEEAPPSTDLETDFCPICQETYKNLDKIATLDCKHEYHAECLEKWLVIKNVCPICKSEALVAEQNKERSSLGGDVSAHSN